jgi:small subunit ribosomal protein S9
MVTKKTKIKEESVKEEKAKKYFYAVGRRKTSVARVKLFSVEGNQHLFKINDRKLDEYFPVARLSDLVKAPLFLSGEGKFEAVVNVSGGGVAAQADAVKLGIARALVVFNNEFKKSLKDKGFLTRDSREVERKKPGLKKARKSPQWAKR